MSLDIIELFGSMFLCGVEGILKWIIILWCSGVISLSCWAGFEGVIILRIWVSFEGNYISVVLKGFWTLVLVRGYLENIEIGVFMLECRDLHFPESLFSGGFASPALHLVLCPKNVVVDRWTQDKNDKETKEKNWSKVR